MKLQMKTTQVHSLMDLIRDIENNEQTQELRLSDGMPDVGRVIGAWGQGILRSKEWHTDHVFASGGAMIWVLYEPEGEDQLQVLSSWIPFQFRWEIPDDVREGTIRIGLRMRYVDARSVSPRKILVRAGMAARAEALVEDVADVFLPPEQAEFPVLSEKESLMLWKEAGEKTFPLDDSLEFPESIPAPEKLIYCLLTPRLTESRVLGDKMVFRGNGILHTAYQSNSGQVCSRDFKVPFSQYVQLDREYGTDASGDIRFCVTSMEADLEPEGKLRLKCMLAAQYVISDRETVAYLKDAYAPGRELELTRKEAVFSPRTEAVRKELTAAAAIPGDADQIPDVLFQPDYPLVHPMGDEVEVSLPGHFQVLHYGPDGKLHCTVSRWEGKETLSVPADCRACLELERVAAEAKSENASIKLRAELELSGNCGGEQRIPMITEMEPGQEELSNEVRPSLILLRCGKDKLWDIAKRTGSTVEQIAAANDLEGECVPGQLLLVPIR